mgnify:CR=1 FL=1
MVEAGQTLAARARSRSIEAWTEIYQRHFDQVYRFVYFRLRDAEAAEDISSDVFKKAFEHADRLRDDGTPIVAWLYRIARNTMFDHLRHNVVRQRVEAPGADASAADATDRVAQHIDMAKALALLNSEQQEVIQLRFMHDLSSQDVARVIGKSESAVKSIQARALQALRREMVDTKGDPLRHESRVP